MSVNNVTRDIVSHTRTSNRIVMTLADCQHTVYRQLRHGLPKTGKVRCPQCTELANGAQVRTGNPDGSETAWGWNYETDMPTARIIPAKEPQ